MQLLLLLNAQHCRALRAAFARQQLPLLIVTDGVRGQRYAGRAIRIHRRVLGARIVQRRQLEIALPRRGTRATPYVLDSKLTTIRR